MRCGTKRLLLRENTASFGAPGSQPTHHPLAIGLYPSVPHIPSGKRAVGDLPTPGCAGRSVLRSHLLPIPLIPGQPGESDHPTLGDSLELQVKGHRKHSKNI